MSVESSDRPGRPGQKVLGNLELNDRCAYTRTCGDTCFLNQVHVDRPALSPDAVYEAGVAMIRRGDVIRHLAFPGKEPFESGALLQRLTRAFHETPVASRPLSLGAISASAGGIALWLPRLSETPLCWLAVSMDVAGSGLRGGLHPEVLESALAGRRAGGTGAVAVNTTFRRETIAGALELASVLGPKNIDQWALCPLVVPDGTTMRSAVDYDTVEQMVERLGAVHDAAAKVVVETDLPTLQRLAADSWHNPLQTDVWRIEVKLPNGVWLFARNPSPGYFLRVRYDGEILSRLDFTQRGLKAGRYGRFKRGPEIDAALERMAVERQTLAEELCEAVLAGDP